MPRAKVCGLTRAADVRAAVDAGADAVGFVVDVDVETPRELTPDRAAELVQAVPPFVTSVLVTMPATAAEVVTLAEQVGVDAVQLHGVPAAAVEVVVDGFHGPVIPAVSTDDVAEYAGVGHALLVDTPSEAGGGGTGRTHDWAATRAATADLDRPVILAGGLTPDNVADAIAATDPFAVDVASGVESSGGVKDHAAVERFVDRATGAT